jgi:hypothetical protein
MATALRGSFHAAVAAYRCGSLEHEQLARAFVGCARVRAIAGYARDVFSVREETQSILQEMWLVFDRASLPILDAPENAYKVLSAISRNVCRTYRGRELTAPLLESDLMDSSNPEGFIERLADRAAPEYDAGDAIDKGRARAALAAKLARLGWPKDIAASTAPTNSSVTPNANMPYTTALLSRPSASPSDKAAELDTLEQALARQTSRRLVELPDARELRSIREELRFSIAALANQLGIGSARLGSYLYGFVHAIPPQIMAAARALRTDHTRSLPRKADLDRIASVSIDDLATQWMDLLGLDHSSTNKRHAALREIATAIGRHPTCFPRWRRTRPSPFAMLEIDQLVRKIAADKKASAGRSRVKVK